MKKEDNQFSYQTHGGIRKGFFRIYQAKSGCIMIVMGGGVAELTEPQVDELIGSHAYDLQDFDHDDYQRYYAEQKNAPVSRGQRGLNQLT